MYLLIRIFIKFNQKFCKSNIYLDYSRVIVVSSHTMKIKFNFLYLKQIYFSILLKEKTKRQNKIKF